MKKSDMPTLGDVANLLIDKIKNSAFVKRESKFIAKSLENKVEVQYVPPVEVKPTLGTCQYCGKVNAPSSRTCSQCGAVLTVE